MGKKASFSAVIPTGLLWAERDSQGVNGTHRTSTMASSICVPDA